MTCRSRLRVFIDTQQATGPWLCASLFMKNHLQEWASSEIFRHRKFWTLLVWVIPGLSILVGFLVWFPGAGRFSKSLPLVSDAISQKGSPWFRNHDDQSGRDIHSIPVTIGRFLDKNRSFSDRRMDAQRLLSLKTPDALQALLDGFGQEQGENRRFLGLLMGNARDPVFENALISLLETGDDADASVAIRSLAAIGGASNLKILNEIMKDDAWPDALRAEAALELLNTGNVSDALSAVSGLSIIGGDSSADKLAEIMRETQYPENLRLEAALGLGVIGTPKAGNALATAFLLFPDPEIHSQLLDSLGCFPFPLIEKTWTEYLAAPATSDELRCVAAEALARSTPEAVPYLRDLVAKDRDSDVREMAAWAISAHGSDGKSGPQLAEMAVTEPDQDVRRRIYEALLNQAENPVDSLLPVIRGETDIAARVAAYNAVGDAVRRSGLPSLTNEFDTQMVPELTRIALSPGILNLRMRAVFALRRAGTPAAREALAEISMTPSKQIAQTAMNGLRQPTQNQMEGEE